jgi:hypothetical protein
VRRELLTNSGAFCAAQKLPTGIQKSLGVMSLRARVNMKYFLGKKIMERLDTYRSLSERTGVPVRTLRSLVYRGVIPHLRLGHRLVFFEPTKVQRALQKREVREV